MSSLKFLSHSQLRSEDIESATNNFASEYIIRDDRVKWVYQGRMLHSGQFIDIVARGIYPKYQNQESKKFRMEKSILSSLSHTNVVSIIGCSDNNNMFIIYKKAANGSLDKYISDETHGCKVPRRHRLLTRDIVKNVYLDPKYKKTRRSAVLRDEELGEGLLSQLAKSHLDDMIDPHLREQMDPEAFKIISETAYYCIQEERAKRPHIDQVVNRLEKALQLQWKRENPVDNTSSNRLK
ncbi:kinase-like domain, phloem protein 2-like protein, partial [Tanacetum coccineum]